MTTDSRRVRATYRLQLHPGFDFAAAAECVDYLADLGVSHVYCSPVLAAVPGSTHGYDVTDPTLINPQLGGEDGLRALAAAADARGLGLVVDLVPNHVGTGTDTPLWAALLSQGASGEAGRFFDVDWSPPLPGAQGKVVLPVLGDQYGVALAAGEFSVVEDDGEVRVAYFDHRFPLSAESADAVARAGGPRAMAGDVADPDSWGRMHALLERQHYRLVWWKAGDALINYRRFFAIDELAGIRVEDPVVFAHTHDKILSLVADGTIDGLRIDHPDGLRDPGGYLAQLAEASGGAWTVVEKILEPGEELPDWPVAGTTGYEFANLALGLFVDPSAESTLDAVDVAYGASTLPYADRVVRAKRAVLAGELRADAGRLGRRLHVLTAAELTVRDVSEAACHAAICRLLQCLHVYRTYVDPITGAANDIDRARIDAAVGEAGNLGKGAAYPDEDVPPALLGFLGAVLRGERTALPDAMELLARFQQLSGAVMAKSVEDTVFYTYRRLTAVNEVGGDPSVLGTTAEAFHLANARAATDQPDAMLTTATHDTKRSEDVRLRIAALSELSDRWGHAALRWRRNEPDRQTQLLALQTIIGLWPLPDDSSDVRARIGARLDDYLVKASREAGEQTNWYEPNAAFETELKQFLSEFLDPAHDADVLGQVRSLARDAAQIAMVSGLAQVLLRCTAPGVADTYQGTELWDDSLVDPDNRRPVDFVQRRELLAAMDKAGPDGAADLWAARSDGRVKLWVLSRALRAGVSGEYTPLYVTGEWGDHVVAYARTGATDTHLVIAPRLPGRVMGADTGDDLLAPLGARWGDTAVVVPEELAGGQWTDLLTGASTDGALLRLAEVLATLPVALLARG